MWRVALILGALGVIAGAGMLTAGLAQAATDPSGVGADPTAGTLTFTDHTTNMPVTSGPGSELLRWNTTDACPPPDNASAVVITIDPDTNKQDSTAGLAESGAGPYAGNDMDDTVANLWQFFTNQTSPTFEVVVVCSSGAAGTEQSAFVKYQYAYITFNSSANTFTISSTNTGGPGPSPSASASHSPSPSASGSPSPSVSGSPSPSASGSPTPTPTEATSILPLGAPATGAGGASHPGGGNKLLIALGTVLLVASAAAAWLAARRGRLLRALALAANGGPDPITPGGTG
jgi:hypothetical protein